MIKDPYIGMPITLGNGWSRPGCNNCINNGTGNMANTGNDMAAGETMGSGNVNGSANMWSEGTFDSMYLGSLPLAMCYVPMQQWKITYNHQEALERGTLFPELDLPFMGRGGMKR